MRLVSLTLENIKSYLNETINFYEGVNFISGLNGAGKSTIIEAIGFALFDASPFTSLRQFIREGEKSGTITVVFEAADERLYRVVRRLRLPSGGAWSVYDLESEAELPQLHGNQDVKTWLSENLGLGKGLDATLLFEDVVGISQGKFTAPFLERGERRKKIFNTILQLEGYREAFERTANLSGTLEKNIIIKQGQWQRLQDKVGDLEDCRENLRKLGVRISEITGELKDLASHLAGLEKDIGLQENYKNSLEKKEKDSQAADVRLTGLAAQQDRLEKDLAAAVLSRDKMAAVQGDYEEYLKLQSAQKDLDGQRKTKENLEKESQLLDNQLTALKAEIVSTRETLKRQLEQVLAEQQETREEGEKTALEVNTAAAGKKQAEERLSAFAEMKEKLCQPKEGLNRYRQEKLKFDNNTKNIQEVQTEILILKEALQGWQEAEREARAVPELETEIRRLQAQLGELTAQAAALEENRLATRGGTCPFLQKPCQNVEGSLEEHFKKEIEKLLPQREQAERKIAEKEALLREGRGAQQKLTVLKHQREQLDKLTAKQNDLLKLQDLAGETIKSILAPQEYHSFLESLGAIAPIIADTKSPVTALLQELTDNIAANERQYGNYLGQNDYAGAADLMAHLLEKWSEIEVKAETALREVYQEAGSRSKGLETRLLFLRDRYKKLTVSLAGLEEDLTLNQKEGELTAKAGQLKAVQDKLRVYQEVDIKWEECRKKLTGLEPAYLEYIQNREGALKVTPLQAELNNLQNVTRQNREMLDQLAVEIRKLQGLYNPELLAEYNSRRDELFLERGKKKGEMDYAAREIERVEQAVREKEKTWQEACDLADKIDTDKKAGELLRLARTVLNNCGELMAEEYRMLLGREAAVIYQAIAGENVRLQWGLDYEVKINDNIDGKERERTFLQLSGGEKMSAALAVRLALLKQLSGLEIGFFDEPTANLDDKRRENLAKIIPDVTKEFRQVFVISHDDTFDAITENTIILKKETGKGTKVLHG